MTEKIGAGGRCDAGPVKAISNNVQAPNSADVAQSQSKNRTRAGGTASSSSKTIEPPASGRGIFAPWAGAPEVASDRRPATDRAALLPDRRCRACPRRFQSRRRRVLLVSPTGSGKTIMFSYILAAAARRGKRVLILAHRAEIIEQIEGALKLAGVAYGLIAAGHPEIDAPVQIASVATIARRLDRWRDRFDFVVVDEAHHAVAGSWAAVLASQPRAHVLGVTATAERLDGRGLGEIFDDLVVGPSTAELIGAGWLSRFVVYEQSAPDLSRAESVLATSRSKTFAMR